MEAFIGREHELSQLERIYERENVKTCMVYGRRRIGKTTLLRRFCQGKRSLMVQFVRSSLKMNMDILADAVSGIAGARPDAADLRQALESVEALCRSEKTVVVFDEIPYLLEDEASKTVMQRFVDSVSASTDSMVVICGSSISFMIEEVLREKRPLYGRFAFRIEVDPMPISETRMFHPSMGDADLLRTYLTLGGVPAYHALVGDVDYREVIDRYLMGSSSVMAADVPYDISEELGNMSDDGFAVLSSISAGYSTYKQIAGRTGLSDNRLSNCLGRLQALHVIEKTESVPVPRKSNTYAVTDRLASFYFSMLRYSSLAEGGSFYDSASPMISAHLGKELEPFCRDLVRRSYPCTSVGTWRGAVPVRGDDGKVVIGPDGKPETEDADIDAVAILREGQDTAVLYGECKFTGKRMGFAALNTLIERIDGLKDGRNRRIALFSVSGFEEGLEEYAESNGIALFGAEELTGKAPLPEIRPASFALRRGPHRHRSPFGVGRILISGGMPVSA